MADSDDRTRGGFSPEAKALFSRAEKFHSTTVHANAARWELHDRASNQGAMREAAKLGFTGIEVERERGGLGLGAREKLRVAEILGRSSLSFALGLLASQNVAVRLATSGSARHRTDLLPGLLAGTRFGAMTPPPRPSDTNERTLTATRNPSGWILNGSGSWIVNAAVSDVFVCYADTGTTGAKEDLACFVVRSGQVGFKLTQPYRLVAGAPVGVAGFEVADYQCLDADMLVEPGDGWRLADEDINCQRLEVAVLACTAVRSALASVADEFDDTHAYGDPALADAVTLLEACEALTATAVDHYCLDPASERTSSLALQAKQFSCRAAERSISTCLNHLGRAGLMESEATGRLISECRILAGLAGSTAELQQETLRRLKANYASTASSDSTVTLLRNTERPEAATEAIVDLREPGADSLASWATSDSKAAATTAAASASVPSVPPMPPPDTQLSPVAAAVTHNDEVASAGLDPEPDNRTLPPMPPPDLRRAGS